MPAISPKLGEFLVKTTGSKDIDDAFHKVLVDYLELKLKTLGEIIEGFQKKWEMNFDEFKENLKEGTIKKDVYSFDTEKDFWRWEEAETLIKHYEEIKTQWI
ncbi:MAG: hypothetical protein SV062_13100 [Thermodesulfobacteriota bacterium]|nr:hypothetical protein [Thermodesulfobacteriota bacterium]